MSADRRRLILGLAAACALAVLAPAACGEKPAPPSGKAAEPIFQRVAPEDLPDIKFANVTTREEKAYLGIAKKGDFSLSEINTDVLLLEFINVACPACQKQAPVLRRLYEKVRRRQDLRERIKFLAVAAGNNAQEAARFKADNGLPYPLLPDPLFTTYDAVGSPGGLPFLLLITLHPEGGGRHLAKGHVGLVGDENELLREIEEGLRAKAEDYDSMSAAFRLGEWRNLKLSVSDAYLSKLLADSAAEIGVKIAGVEPVKLTTDEVVYRLDAAGGRRLWAKVAGRVKICNLCHNIFFIILFDDAGRIVNFTPIDVTKNWNEKWDGKDIAFTRKRLVGRHLTGEAVFDPKVDAVTSATMSSGLIFDTVRRLSETYRLMQKRNLVG